MAKDKGTPTPDKVTRAALEDRDVSLRDVIVIGLFTGPKGAKALLRTPGGRFEEVSVGDAVGSATVAAIDADHLILAKGGETQRLQVADSTEQISGADTRTR